jgi:hypothetical protein
VANRSARDIAEAPADIGSGDIRDPARKETNAQVDKQALCEQGLDVMGRDTVTRPHLSPCRLYSLTTRRTKSWTTCSVLCFGYGSWMPRFILKTSREVETSVAQLCTLLRYYNFPRR